MKIFEYLCVTFPSTFDTSTLNLYGLEGWELCVMTNHGQLIFKREIIEQLQAENQRLKLELENVERVYLDDYNKTCKERDEAMMKLEDLELEASAYKGALRQLLTSLMFPPPGVCWLGTGDQAMDALIDQAIKNNGLNMAQSTHNRKVYVGFVKPKEE